MSGFLSVGTVRRKLGRGLAVFASAAALFSVSAWAATVTVTQKHRAFSVKSIDIVPGDTVKFVNDDDFIHQIYVDSPAMTFDSAEQNPGKDIDLTFPKAGTFQVLCHIHPKMLLTVNVK